MAGVPRLVAAFFGIAAVAEAAEGLYTTSSSPTLTAAALTKHGTETPPTRYLLYSMFASLASLAILTQKYGTRNGAVISSSSIGGSAPSF